MNPPLQKPTASGSRFSRAIRQLSAVVSAVLALALPTVHAATRYWDGGNVDIVANGDGNSDGTSGTWNTTLKNWDQGNGLAHVAWVNGGNTAEINNASQTLTLGANIILGGIVQKSGGASVAIAGGSGPYTLTLGITGANTFLAAANDTTGRTLTVNAVIAGPVGRNLVLAGPATSDIGTINLGGANTFSGTTSFSSGATGGARAVLNHQLALQNSTVLLSADANLVFNDSVSAKAFTLGGLSSTSAGTGFNLALQNDAASPLPIALTVGGNNSSTTYKGVLSGGGSLIKTGSGILTLGGANIYTGTTTVSAGTLEVDGSSTSPTTVNGGATLAGDGTMNAAVTVNSGGSITPGANNLTVSNLIFNGSGTLNIGNLTDHTSVAALKVNSALTVSGGAGAVTINLPTALGFNGTYRLIQFGSGVANASGFTLGTVPTLAWNQTGSLQVNGGFLNYVISATGDTTPPTLSNTLPINNATNVLAAADLVATFDETIVAGSGSIEIRRSSDAVVVESFNVASSSRLTFSTTQLVINPTNNLPTNQTYYVLIPAGTIKDTSGNNYAGITANTGWRFTVTVPPVLFTDSGSPANPLWSAILPTLNVDSPDQGPVYGSDIDVNNAAVEVGLYGNRPISLGGHRIHVACHTSTTSFANFTRWFQTDGNTQILRVFVNDENTATTREGVSSHTEAFNDDGWNYATAFKTYEWTARYTIARLEQGYCCFQLKNTDNDWAVQLSMGTNGSLTVNNRTGADTVVTNPDGSVKNFTGGGFDVRVLDDGLNYKLWIDGVLYADSSYSRPTGTTVFRWGMYFGANNLNPPASYNLILVSGAQVKSWPGRLTAATTTRTKDNNGTNLNNALSWVGDVAPGIHNQALWDSTVTAANSTTLAADQQWAGVKITNPGGNVTINGSSILSLDDAGVDLTTSTRNLTINCPVQLSVPSNWSVASGRTATFNGTISGFPGLTVNGAGTVQLDAANTYSGDTTVSAGTLVANDNLALSSGTLNLNGGNLSNTASCALGNDVNLNSNAAINVDPSQTLTLRGALAGSGSLTKTNTGTLTLSGANANSGSTLVSSGTLAVGNTSALLSTSSLTLAGGTVLQPNLDGVVITAPITVGSTGTTATISAPTNTPGGGVVSTLTLDSVLSGSGNVTFSSSVNQNALSTVYLGAQSTYTGSTLLNTTASTDGTTVGESQIILKLGAHNALPTTTVLTIDGGNGSGTGRFAELNLNGFDQQLTGLANIARSGTAGTLRRQRVVNSNVSAAATLTINNSSNFSFSGILGAGADGSVSASSTPGSANGNNFSLTKSGAGSFTLSGANSYAGGTTISGGKLIAQSSNTALGANSVSVASPATLQLHHNLASGTTLAIANAITGNGILEFSSDAAPATGDLNRVTVGSLSGFTGDINVLPNGMFGHFTAGNTTNQNLTIASGGYMAMSEDVGFGRLNGAGKIIRNVGVSTTKTLTLGSNNATGGNFSGSIEGASTTSNSGTFNSSGIIAVTKVGTGVQTLSGVNTYTGPTTINAGTLALGVSNALANTTAVSIGNATLDASTFTDTVGTLDLTSTARINLGTGAALAFANSSAVDWTGGSLTITGTFVSGSSLRFGTTSSGLTPAQLARITVSGVPAFALDANGYLIPGLTADYTSWKATNAPTGAPSDDFDGDGVANGIEYVLGGTAFIRDFDKLPGFSTAGGNLAFTFIRDQASIDGSTAITIEVGETLTDWQQSFPVPDTATTNNPGLTVVKNSPSAGQDTVTLILPLNPGGKTFVRLKVMP
jgi:fibronectin-binding autotransporter adhesin